MKIAATAVGLAVLSVALVLNVVPMPDIHFPGIVPVVMLACVVLILTLGIRRTRPL